MAIERRNPNILATAVSNQPHLVLKINKEPTSQTSVALGEKSSFWVCLQILRWD
jgi:hypothetical protein